MLSQDITSLCPYHPHPPTYIHNCVSPALHTHVPSPSPASSIHRSQGPRGGSWEISPLLPPPSQLSKSGTTLSGPSLSSHFFPQAHCLRADTPTALPGSVPWLPLGPSFNLFVTPSVLESSPNRNCVSGQRGSIYSSPIPTTQRTVSNSKLSNSFMFHTLPLLTFHLPPLLTSEFCSSVVSPVAPLASRLMLPSFVEVAFLFLCLVESNLHRN